MGVIGVVQERLIDNATSVARAIPPPPGIAAAWARGSFRLNRSSGDTVVSGTSSARPNSLTRCSRAGTAPAARIVVTEPSSGVPSTDGTPAGAATRLLMTSAYGRPDSVSIISAITQCAAIGWYSVREPAGQSRCHSANL